MAAKFVQFIDAADDAATYPADSLLGMTCASDGALLVKFASSVGGGTGAEHDSIALTITANTEKTVMKSIGEAIAFSKQAVLVIADDVTSDYVDANITACAITLDA